MSFDAPATMALGLFEHESVAYRSGNLGIEKIAAALFEEKEKSSK